MAIELGNEYMGVCYAKLFYLGECLKLSITKKVFKILSPGMNFLQSSSVTTDDMSTLVLRTQPQPTLYLYFPAPFISVERHHHSSSESSLVFRM